MPTCLELRAQLRDRPLDVRLAALAPRVEQLGELAEPLGLEDLEREVLELPLDLPDAEPLRQRRVDLHRLARDPLLLLGRQGAERAHVVQPVGELDEHDADVLGHRQEHLPDVLGLLLLVAVGAELRQLRDAVDELRDLGAEALLDVGEAVLGVLGDVVEQRRRDRDRVDPEVGQDLGRRDRVGDVRLARRPDLASRAPRPRGRTRARPARGRPAGGAWLSVGEQERRGASGPSSVACGPAASRRGPAGCARPARAAPGRRAVPSLRCAVEAAPRDRGRRARPWQRVYRVPCERRPCGGAVSRAGRSRDRRQSAGRRSGDTARRSSADRQVLAAAHEDDLGPGELSSRLASDEVAGRRRPRACRATAMPPRLDREPVRARERRRVAAGRPGCAPRRRRRSGPRRRSPSITVVAVTSSPPPRDGDLVQGHRRGRRASVDRDVGQRSPSMPPAVRSRIETSRSTRSSSPIARSAERRVRRPDADPVGVQPDEVGRRVARHRDGRVVGLEARGGDRGRQHAGGDRRQADDDDERR